MTKKNAYSASITAGGLLYDETIALLPYLNSKNIGMIRDQVENSTLLKTNAESSRKRIIAEIYKRYKKVIPSIFKLLNRSQLQEQKVILYFICLKTYPLLFDFVVDIVIKKWLSRELTISSNDVLRFLNLQSARHSEIDSWSDSTTNKVCSAIIRIIRESGFIINSELTTVNLPNSFWRYFHEMGETWFLKAALLNKQQREQIIG